MKKRSFILVMVLMVFGGKAHCQGNAPLKLVQTFKLPADVKGNFDHFEIDLKAVDSSRLRSITKRSWCST